MTDHTHLPPEYHFNSRLFDDLSGRPPWMWLLVGNLSALVPLGAAVLLLWLPYQVYAAVGAPWAAFAAPPWGTVGDVLWAVGLCALLMIAHEVLHTVVLRVFGYQARMGWAFGYLYATLGAGQYLRRNDYLAMTLAPLTVLSLVGGVLVPFLPAALGHGLVYALLLNAAASIGDLWVAWRVVSHPHAALFADNPERGGICVYLPR
jgi:hypothetical protein